MGEEEYRRLEIITTPAYEPSARMHIGHKGGVPRMDATNTRSISFGGSQLFYNITTSNRENTVFEVGGIAVGDSYVAHGKKYVNVNPVVDEGQQKDITKLLIREHTHRISF